MPIEHAINPKLMSLELDVNTGDVKKHKSLYNELYARMATIKGTNLRNKLDGTFLRLTPNELAEVDVIVDLLHDCQLAWNDLVKAGRISNVEMIPVSYKDGTFSFLARCIDIEDNEVLELPWSL